MKKHLLKKAASAAMILGLMVGFTNCDPKPVEPILPGGGSAIDPTTLSGTINANQVLVDLGLPVDYVIDGGLYLDGNALLTVMPGVSIMFTDTDGYIEVGENAGLKMVGEPLNPIVIQGPANNTSNGSWNYIKYTSKRNDNMMEYVKLLRGGSDEGSDYGVVIVSDGKLSMKNCVVDGGLACGVATWYDGYFTEFENNTIKNVKTYPLYIHRVDSYKNIGLVNIYENNGKNYIYVESGYYSLEEDITFKKHNIPYLFSTGLDFSTAITVTIEPGAMMMFGNKTTFEVGESTTLKALGTEESPVIIRGFENEAGYWNGIMYESIRTSSEMIHCIVTDGGSLDGWYENHNLYIRSNAKLTLTNCHFANSQYYGVVIENIDNFPSNVTHSGCTFLANGAGNVYDEYNGIVFEMLP